MKAQRVSIVDETGQLLANGAAGDGAADGGSGDERRASFEKRMRDQVEAIVSQARHGWKLLVENCGHTPHLERPAELQQLMQAFIEELPQTSACLSG